MNSIQRIRPQSKRKAINAKAFELRYLAEMEEAERAGDGARATKAFLKSVYWARRHALYRRLSHTWPAE